MLLLRRRLPCVDFYHIVLRVARRCPWVVRVPFAAPLCTAAWLQMAARDRLITDLFSVLKGHGLDDLVSRAAVDALDAQVCFPCVF
jgi:hypothetical protein